MSLSMVRYSSAALRQQTAMYVIAPDSPGPHPVIYQLHGMSDDYSIWQRRTTIEMHASRIGAMVVLLEGGQGFSTDKADGTERWESHVLETVALVDATFRTRTDRQGRAIGGLSMGGYGALKIGLKHPARFGSVVAHSGALDIVSRYRDFLADPYGRALMQAVFGPGPGAGDDLFALATAASTTTSRPSAKTAKTTRTAAAPASATALPQLSIDCGREDFLLEENRRLHAHLEALRIPHTYQEHPGGHSWEYWEARLQASFDFHHACFAAASA